MEALSTRISAPSGRPTRPSSRNVTICHHGMSGSAPSTSSMKSTSDNALIAASRRWLSASRSASPSISASAASRISPAIQSKDPRKARAMNSTLAPSMLFIALAFRGSFDWIAGLILLAALALMLGDALRDALSHRRDAAIKALSEVDFIEDVEGADPDMPWWQIVTFLVLGLVGLPLGADILVDNASILAMRYGISDAAIGLTLVALGTSLPELATTVMAALRKQADVALGNVIGSNMFNLLAIIGITALVGDIPVDSEFLSFDLWVMLAASLILIPFVILCRDIGRLWGIVLTCGYVGYVTLVLV